MCHRLPRAPTALSPLQYQKRLGFQAARDRMLNDGLDATNVAFEVGCESARRSVTSTSAFSASRR